MERKNEDDSDIDVEYEILKNSFADFLTYKLHSGFKKILFSHGFVVIAFIITIITFCQINNNNIHNLNDSDKEKLGSKGLAKPHEETQQDYKSGSRQIIIYNYIEHEKENEKHKGSKSIVKSERSQCSVHR